MGFFETILPALVWMLDNPAFSFFLLFLFFFYDEPLFGFSGYGSMLMDFDKGSTISMEPLVEEEGLKGIAEEESEEF